MQQSVGVHRCFQKRESEADRVELTAEGWQVRGVRVARSARAGVHENTCEHPRSAVLFNYPFAAEASAAWLGADGFNQVFVVLGADQDL